MRNFERKYGSESESNRVLFLKKVFDFSKGFDRLKDRKLNSNYCLDVAILNKFERGLVSYWLSDAIILEGGVRGICHVECEELGFGAGDVVEVGVDKIYNWVISYEDSPYKDCYFDPDINRAYEKVTSEASEDFLLSIIADELGDILRNAKRKH